MGLSEKSLTIGEKTKERDLQLEKTKHTIVLLSRKEQAEFAEEMVKQNYNNEHFLTLQFLFANVKYTREEEIETMENYKPTLTIGNLAYISLHSKKQFATIAERQIKEYTDYVKTTYLKNK